MAFEPTLKTLWNMDDAVLKSIHNLKVVFITQMQGWMLGDAYWTLRNIRMEIDSKLKENEQKDAETKLKALEEVRKKFIKDKKNKRGDFYVALENYCILLNRFMKSHGLYFREGSDPRRAVLKR